MALRQKNDAESALRSGPHNTLLTCIVATALRVREDAIEEVAKRCEADEQEDRLSRILSEALYFLAHVTSRYSFQQFGPEIRRRIHETTASLAVQKTLRLCAPAARPKDIAAAHSFLMAELMQREALYGRLPRFVPAPAEPTGFFDLGSVIGVFADTLSELQGNGELRFGFNPPKDSVAYLENYVYVPILLKNANLQEDVLAYGSSLGSDGDQR